MTMVEFFDEVLTEYCEDFDAEWYEVVDSELLDDVICDISQRLGIDLDELDEMEEFIDWYNSIVSDV